MREQAFTLAIKPAEASQLEMLEHECSPDTRCQNLITGATKSSNEGKESISSPGTITPLLVTSCCVGAALMMRVS